MTSRIRFGIVGTGGIANTHAAALAALADDAELVSICDIAPDRVANFAERWGVRGQYDSPRWQFSKAPSPRILNGGYTVWRWLEIREQRSVWIAGRSATPSGAWRPVHLTLAAMTSGPFQAIRSRRSVAMRRSTTTRAICLTSTRISCEDIIGAVRDKRPPAVSGEDGRRVVAIIQGVYESGRSGRPVKLGG